MSVPRKTRVFLVDDSKLSRIALRRMLESDSRIRVVGEAGDGAEALRRIPGQRPDLVMMDVMMPRLNGIDVTRRLMCESPLPIVVVSDICCGRESMIFEALDAGALDVVRKPSRSEVLDAAGCARFARRMRSLAGVPVVTRRRGEPAADLPGAATSAPRPPAKTVRFEHLVIGASTGGPMALARLLGRLGPSPPSAVVVVQHIAEGFGEGLGKWLQAVSGCPVEVVRDDTLPRPGRVYLAPDDQHLEYRGRRLVVSGEPSETLHRPSIDVLFESVVASQMASRTVAVLLTGMGRDGAGGLLGIRQAGGWTIAQDEATSTVYGMPAAARNVGATCEIQPIDAIGPRILALFNQSGPDLDDPPRKRMNANEQPGQSSECPTPAHGQVAVVAGFRPRHLARRGARRKLVLRSEPAKRSAGIFR